MLGIPRNHLPDIIVLLIFQTTNVIGIIWPLLTPWFTYYAQEYNPNIQFNHIIRAGIFFYLGCVLSNYFIFHEFKLLGLKLTWIINGVLYFLCCLSWISFLSITGIYFNAMATGYFQQIFTQTTMVFISSKYGKQLTPRYSSIVLCGPTICSVLWNLILGLFMNSSVNSNRTNLSEISKGNLYDSETLANLPNFFYFAGSVVCFVMTMTGLLLDNPPDYNGSFSTFFQHSIWFNTQSNANDEMLLLQKDASIEMTESKKETVSKISTPIGENIKVIIEEAQQNEESIKAEAFGELKTQKFIILFIGTIIRNTSSRYHLINQKNIGLMATRNEYFLTYLFSIGTVISFVSRFSTGFILERFGMKMVILVLIFVSLLIDSCAVMSSDSTGWFVLMIVTLYVSVGISSPVTTNTLYFVYGHKKTVHILKYFELQILLSILFYTIVFESLFTGHNFTDASKVFLVIDSIGIFFVWKFLNL